MKSAKLKHLTSCLLIVLCSCVQRDVVMVMPNPNLANTVTIAKNLSTHCYSPDDKQYKKFEPVVTAGVIAPQRAKDEHVSGCAALKFQVGDDGKATNVTLLREYPDGYGYGAAMSDAVKRSTFKAPTNSGDWYYFNTSTIYNQ